MSPRNATPPAPPPPAEGTETTPEARRDPFGLPPETVVFLSFPDGGDVETTTLEDAIRQGLRFHMSAEEAWRVTGLILRTQMRDSQEKAAAEFDRALELEKQASQAFANAARPPEGVQ